jgi:hypothetical protein
MTRTYGWQRFYEDAILETNRVALPRRIRAAQAAIDARIAQLESNHDGSSDERHAIFTALQGLKLLREPFEGATQHPSQQMTERH